MNKSILGGLIALGVGAFCDKPKPPSLFDGQNMLIKAEGVSCGFIGSIETEGNQVQLKNVTLDKHQVGKIFSGGFIVKPAQRLGMTLEINQNGETRTITNVWIEEMTPYKEGRETVTIDHMICSIENTEEQPEQARVERKEAIQKEIARVEAKAQGIANSLTPKPLEAKITDITLTVGDVSVGKVQTLSVNLDHANPKVNLHRIRFDKLRVTEAFAAGLVSHHSQRIPFQIEIKVNGKVVGNLTNFWFTKLDWTYQTEDLIIIDSADGECESAKFDDSI